MSESQMSGLTCRFLGHDWEVTEFRVTHGRVECGRCGRAEWRRG